MMYRVKTLVAVARKPAACLSLKTIFSAQGLKHASRCLYGTQVSAEPFMNGSSSTYIKEMYIAWQKDTESVHKVTTACI